MALETVLDALGIFSIILIGSALFWWSFEAPKRVEALCSFLVHESNINEILLPTPSEVSSLETEAPLLEFVPQPSSPNATLRHSVRGEANKHTRARNAAKIAPGIAAIKETWYFIPFLSGLAVSL